MKAKTNFYKAGFFLAAFFYAAASIAQVRGSGNTIKQDRETGPFTKIEIGGAFRAQLIQGDNYMVTVLTDDNLQSSIETRVLGNTLVVEAASGMKNLSELSVVIQTPVLEKVQLDGAARLTTNGTFVTPRLTIEANGASRINMSIQTEALETKVNGAARLTLEGETITHETEVAGASRLNALKLKTTTTKAEVSGAGRASVFANSEIFSDISGAGRLSYFDENTLKQINRAGIVTIHPNNDGQEPNLEAIAKMEEYDAYPNADSVIVNVGDVKIEVYDGDKTKVIIGSNELKVDEDGKVSFKRNRQEKFDGHFGGFEMGVNGFVNSSGEFDLPTDYEFLDLRMEKSINVKLNLLEQNFNLIRNKLGLTTGLGLEWKNYRFNDNVELVVMDGDIFNNYEQIPRNYTKSKLVVNYLNVPLMLEYQTNRFSKRNSFHISAGVQAGLRIGSHTKNVYQENGKKKKMKDRDDFYLNPIKYDLSARIGWGKINLYADYSLNTLFKNNRGPELYPFTLGITLISW